MTSTTTQLLEHSVQDGADVALTLNEFAAIVREAINQPPWRAQADKEADYADGNQLSTDLMRKQQAMGIPPAKENVIGPAIAAVCGYEAKTRTDWRVTPDGDPSGKDVAEALNYKLNQAERHSKADRALSQAFRAMITTGLGWVEVARPASSLEFPQKCRYIHRNEIWWDMKAVEPDLSDARWLYRRRWVERSKAARMFPSHAPVILRTMEKWIADNVGEMLEGGISTGLQAAAEAERAWTVQEDAWFNEENQTVAITEVWYRRWVPIVMMVLRNGRAVEYDASNPVHSAAVQAGQATLREEVTPRVRRAYWIGPHQLFDGPSPYPHNAFPYVPVWGYREDMTNVPYGIVRDMMFPQDNLNSSISKLRWGMSAVETIRSKGALAMSDDQFRRSAARVDADFVLDPKHFQEFPNHARFERKRDFQLNDQQFQLMNDSRMAVERVSGITAAFQGQRGSARSGVQEQTQLEQSQVSIADLMDSFKEARMLVGELLMSLLIEDMGREEQTVVIEGDALSPARTVVLNHPERDPATGLLYLSNDVSRTRMKVALEDVPTSSSFRAQQLAALSEASKSAPPELQQVILPHMVHMMDLPKKDQIVEAIQAATQQTDPEAIREQVKQELMHDLKERELAMKERLSDAQIEKLIKEAVQTGVQSAFSAVQAAAQVSQMPMLAPVADMILKDNGHRPDPNGIDPNIPTPDATAAVNMPHPYIQGGGGAEAVPEEDPAITDVRANTSPAFPPVAQEPGTGMRGSETPTVSDNLP